ncbi:AGE family epimerase/isomerase [Acetobacter suratthaniensis]|uniref:AGE family epimerase/isomerase n=1 Tax=Acetobacter suratthaniensis TaxID=1502841 RepID=A0ABS3LJ37_9PROT|nr:AGE family epimerase/isomerase [Acetobacter suratthaniensis]MBO1327015.1 AGE family epimerase/isomerase [Acetobacter suratthaniensis]MCX2565376.1 AGE family epimerase/isomerase [Acetobacter suratthaniensis]
MGHSPVCAQQDAASALAAVHVRFTDWLFGQALPFWADTGCDSVAGAPAFLGAQEHLTGEGVPALPPFKRVRVQARQLFVFSWAALRGWPEARARADGIFRFLLNARRADGGWACRLTRSGAVLDNTADLYDLAFVVFALAWYARLDRADGQAITLARETLRWIEAAMPRPDGGFVNCLPDDGAAWQQNPHMHLFEAVLALYDTTGQTDDLTLAHRLHALFSTRFFDPVTGCLGEYFQAGWLPAAGEAGQWTEPGHHFEWVWLLHAYTARSGVETHRQADSLYRFALAHGVVAETALVRDAVGRGGQVLSNAARLWVQGEALRGILRHDAQGNGLLAARVADNLLTRYLHGPVACASAGATWTDQLDAQGQPAAERIPTSSLYHIVTAYDELDRAVQEGWAGKSRA